MGVHTAPELCTPVTERKPSMLDRGNAYTVYTTRLLNLAPCIYPYPFLFITNPVYTAKVWGQ